MADKLRQGMRKARDKKRPYPQMSRRRKNKASSAAPPADPNVLRQRSYRVLESARHINKDYLAAMDRGDWNIAIRRAQEAVELITKAAVLFAGMQPIEAHGTQPALQLRRLLTERRRQLTTHVPADGIPAWIEIMRVYEMGLPKEERTHNIIRLGTLNIESGRLDGPKGATVYRSEKNVLHTKLQYPFPGHMDSIDVVSDSGRFALAHKQDVFLVADADRFALVEGQGLRYLSDQDWEGVISAAEHLGQRRESSFYREVEHTQAEAVDAGRHAKHVVNGVQSHIAILDYPLSKP